MKRKSASGGPPHLYEKSCHSAVFARHCKSTPFCTELLLVTKFLCEPMPHGAKSAELSSWAGKGEEQQHTCTEDIGLPLLRLLQDSPFIHAGLGFNVTTNQPHKLEAAALQSYESNL